MPTRSYLMCNDKNNSYDKFRNFIVLEKINEDDSKCYNPSHGFFNLDNVHINRWINPKEKASLKEFILSGMYEVLFDEDVKDEAIIGYDGKINKSLDQNLSKNEFSGIIIGTDEKEYNVKVSIDNHYVVLSCSCPLGGECEHLCAALNEIRKENDPKYKSHAEAIHYSLTKNTSLQKENTEKRKERLKARYDFALLKEKEAKAIEEEEKAEEQNPSLRLIIKEIRALRKEISAVKEEISSVELSLSDDIDKVADAVKELR